MLIKIIETNNLIRAPYRWKTYFSWSPWKDHPIYLLEIYMILLFASVLQKTDLIIQLSYSMQLLAMYLSFLSKNLFPQYFLWYSYLNFTVAVLRHLLTITIPTLHLWKKQLSILYWSFNVQKSDKFVTHFSYMRLIAFTTHDKWILQCILQYMT